MVSNASDDFPDPDMPQITPICPWDLDADIFEVVDFYAVQFNKIGIHIIFNFQFTIFIEFSIFRQNTNFALV